MNEKVSKNISISKLKEEIINNKKNLMNLNFQKSTGQLEKVHQIKKTKKTIAKLKAEVGRKMREQNA